MVLKVDVAVIGAGSGGYPAAIRSAHLGKKVVIIEKGLIGGECLNWGCIPSKALIYASDFYYKILHEVSQLGITSENVQVDIRKMQEWKEKVVSKLVSGIKVLLAGNKVQTMLGSAKFLSKNQLEVLQEDGSTEIVEADDIIIATGTEFRSLPGMQINDDTILSAKGALELDHIPEEILCIGGGIIGLELGTVYAKLGSKVKIVEVLSNIITGVDASLVDVVKQKLRSLGVEIFTETKVTQIDTGEDGKLSIEIESKEMGLLHLSADKILLAVGKVPITAELDLEKVGVKTDEKGFLITNSKQQTNIEHIYAVGDCTGMPFLAHKATKQGIIAAEVIAGEASEADFRAMPGAVFTDPEIAFAGLFEEEAKKAGYEVVVAQAPFTASGRALTQLDTEGFVNVVVDADNGVLLGAQIVGPHASDLISEVALALEMGATAEDIGLTVHPHPTLPEMIMEAVEAALGKAIHVANVKRKN